MLPSEILDSLSPQDRRRLIVSAALAALGLLLGIYSLVPPKITVEQTTFQVASLASPIPGRGPASSKTPGYVVANFRLKVGARVKGQRLTFKEIRLFDSRNRMLGVLPIQSITRNLSQTTGPDETKVTESPQVVTGVMFLYPLEPATLTVPAFAQDSFGIASGTKLRAEIIYKTSMLTHRIKTPYRPANGIGAG